MDISYVKKLVKLLSDSQIDEIEIEEDGKKIRVARNRNHSIGTYQTPPSPQGHATIGPPPESPSASGHASATPAPLLETPPTPVGTVYHEIKSPIVGTFYKAPAPDAAPFVEVGSMIHPGTVLCIVEAMKLMNEIESDVSGKIAKIMVQNAQPVEYGQTLFLVEKE